jgi:hypothetical protein
LLRDGGFIERTADDPPGYLPARDLGTISLAELLSAVRTAGETPLLNERSVALPEAAREIAVQATRAAESVLAGRTVRDMFLDVDDPGTTDDVVFGSGPIRR